MSSLVGVCLTGALVALALGAFLVLFTLTPALMYRHHLKARQRAETPPDGIPQVPDCETGEAA